MIKIIAVATGLAAVLGAGSILLAALQNSAWPAFLGVAVFVFIIGVAIKLL